MRFISYARNKTQIIWTYTQRERVNEGMGTKENRTECMEGNNLQLRLKCTYSRLTCVRSHFSVALLPYTQNSHVFKCVQRMNECECVCVSSVMTTPQNTFGTIKLFKSFLIPFLHILTFSFWRKSTAYSLTANRKCTNNFVNSSNQRREKIN